jgi:methionyl-tRNA synthetase
MEGIATFEDWQKINLVVGQIKEVSEIDGADKLLKITLDLGTEERTICAGIKKFYSPEQLLNKKVIIFKNLTPRIMRGINSEGMLLAAINSDESSVVLLSPEKDIEVGSIIR